MHKSKSQSGSAHVVIIIILSVGLIGALSVLFWQNIINKPQPHEAQAVATKTPEPSLKPKPKTYCVKYEKLCFDYPHDWSVEYTPINDGNRSEVAAIKDDDGKTWLDLETGMTGLGGACGHEDGWYSKIIKTHTTAIEGDYLVNEGASEWVDPLTYAYAAMTYDPDSKSWTINMALNISKTVQKIGRVDPCDIGFNTLNGKNAIVRDLGTPGAMTFEYNDIKGDTQNTYSSESEAMAALESENARKAYDILKSARYQ